MGRHIYFALGVTSTTLLLLARSITAQSTERLDTCDGLDGVTLNATNSVIRDQFLNQGENVWDAAPLKQWTWHTGLDGTNLSSPRQYFWIDTTGSVNLNSPESPYNSSCITILELDHNSDFWNTPPDGILGCTSMLGDACLTSLSSLSSEVFDSAPNECSVGLGTTSAPDECSMLKTISVSKFPFYPKVTRKQTCGSTENNADGSKSAFYATGYEDNKITDFTLYDKMAKVGYLFIIGQSYSDQSGATYSSYSSMCMRNIDFAKGSRNPLPKETRSSGNPTGANLPKPTGGAAKGSPSLVVLAAALFVGVFALFN